MNKKNPEQEGRQEISRLYSLVARIEALEEAVAVLAKGKGGAKFEGMRSDFEAIKAKHEKG